MYCTFEEGRNMLFSNQLICCQDDPFIDEEQDNSAKQIIEKLSYENYNIRKVYSTKWNFWKSQNRKEFPMKKTEWCGPPDESILKNVYIVTDHKEYSDFFIQT